MVAVLCASSHRAGEAFEDIKKKLGRAARLIVVAARPKHNEAATNEAETLWSRLESSITMIRIAMVIAVKSVWIQKVRGSGLPSERGHSLISLISEVSAGRTSKCPFENKYSTITATGWKLSCIWWQQLMSFTCRNCYLRIQDALSGALFVCWDMLRGSAVVEKLSAWWGGEQTQQLFWKKNNKEIIVIEVNPRQICRNWYSKSCQPALRNIFWEILFW